MEQRPNIVLLVAGLRKEVQNLISEGIGLVWESYKLDPYVQRLAELVVHFQEKVDEVLVFLCNDQIHFCINYLLCLCIAEFARIKFGSKKILEDFTFSKDLNAKIAIGSSVQPNIIFLHFSLVNSFIAGCIVFAAALTFPILTNFIALFTDFFCRF